MSNQSPITQGFIPDLPRDISIDKDGKLNYATQLSLSNLYQALQGLVSNQGVRLPGLTASQITNINTLYQSFIGVPLPANVPNIAGTIAYDIANATPIFFQMSFNSTTLAVLATPQWKAILHA